MNKKYLPDRFAIWESLEIDPFQCGKCPGVRLNEMCQPDICHRIDYEADSVAEWIEENCLMLNLIREVKQ